MAVILTCGLLLAIAVFNVQGKCEDKLNTCANYPKDTCKKYAEWSLKNCAKWCRLCQVASCPSGWYLSTSDNKCLGVFGVASEDNRKTWFDARNSCKRDGADLVMIKDNTKKTFIQGLLMKGIYYWIGIQNVNKVHGIDMQYVDGTKVSSYTDWNPLQPDNFINREHCVLYVPSFAWSDKGGWSDVDCRSDRAFVCEKSALS